MDGMSFSLTHDGLSDTVDRIPTRTLVAVIIALHVALTSWQLWFIQINDDGVLYVQAARLFADGRFSDARAVYSWFGFPLLIAAVSKVTTLDALIAGKLVNLVASTGTLILLLRMSWIQLPSRVTLFIVSLLIFGNFWWNELRGALVRDQMFYFFVILSFFFLFRDGLRPRLINKLGFACACICASLFRIEAAALLVMVPALLVALGARPRKYRIVAFTAWLAAAAAVFLAVGYQAESYVFSRLFSAPTTRIKILHDKLLAPYASRKAFLAYNSMIAGLVASGLLSSLNPLAIALTGWRAAQSTAFRRQYVLRLLASYVAATFFVLAAQTYFSLVFEPRYGLAAGVLLTIPAAVAATTLIEANVLRQRYAALALTLIVAWLGYGLFGLKVIDQSRFQLAAGQWLRENVPPGAKTLSNNNQISFYGDLPFRDKDDQFLVRSVSGIEDISALRLWTNYDVVVVRLRKNQLDQVPRLDAAIGKPPAQEFANSRGDKILIYEPRKPS